MKKFKYILLFALIIFSVSSFGLNPDDGAIISAIKSGNSVAVSKYFNSNVELSILDNEDVYSKSQAQIILKDFFAKHKVISFKVLHQGGKNGSNYLIGNLVTSNGTFRVYYLLKKVGNKQLIQQFRIEDE
ncbi:MAG: DUF4783 domain-containing protein [Bacteroidetes bacterium]|nr:MAG: DUF4783 domain-containing protein [Bacteroidota bacterium]